jgi:hypothetical protein
MPVIINLPKISGTLFYKPCKWIKWKEKKTEKPKITEAAHEDPRNPNSSSYAFEPRLLEITNRICRESKMHTEI